MSGNIGAQTTAGLNALFAFDGAGNYTIDSNAAFEGVWTPLALTIDALDAITLNAGGGFNVLCELSVFSLKVSQAALIYGASVEVNFAFQSVRTVTLAGDIEFTTTGLAEGRGVSVKIAGGTGGNFTFPASWKFLGAVAPVSIAAGKTAVLSLTAFGATDADVIAAYAVEP